jgi:acyl-coenzyme A thioesterase PaaI-like protein
MIEPDQAHFELIPWCSALLNDPSFTITPTFSRQPKLNTEDSLIASTLNSPQTVKACLSLYKTPPKGDPWISEVRTLMSLGTGMNGGPFMLHGGIVAALMDDVIGTLLTVNKSEGGLPLSTSTVTAYLNVSYLRLVSTPQTVLVVARSREVKGKKFFMESEIRDGEGGVLARAESLWIRRAQDKEKL